MKKKQIKNLRLNKISISKIDFITGGMITQAGDTKCRTLLDQCDASFEPDCNSKGDYCDCGTTGNCDE